MGSHVPRIQRTGQYLSHLFDDGHLDPLGACQLEDGTHRSEALRRLLHLFDDVVEAVSLAEQPASSVVA